MRKSVIELIDKRPKKPPVNNLNPLQKVRRKLKREEFGYN